MSLRFWLNEKGKPNARSVDWFTARYPYTPVKIEAVIAPAAYRPYAATPPRSKDQYADGGLL